MTDADRAGIDQAASWRESSWGKSDLSVRAPFMSRHRWPIIFGFSGLVVALVFVGIVLSMTRQAQANKQVRYDVPDLGNTPAGHSHTGPLLAFLPATPRAAVITEQESMTKGDLAPVHFGTDEQINPWRTVVRGAFRAVIVPNSGKYEFCLFQFRDDSAAERYASITVGNWKTGPFSIGAHGPLAIPDVPSGYALADGPRPDNSTNVYALAVRGDIVIAILGTQNGSKSLSPVELYASDAYARL
jgi:hypothetical protein